MKLVRVHLLHIVVRRHMQFCSMSLCCYVAFDEIPLRRRGCARFWFSSPHEAAAIEAHCTILVLVVGERSIR